MPTAPAPPRSGAPRRRGHRLGSAADDRRRRERSGAGPRGRHEAVRDRRPGGARAESEGRRAGGDRGGRRRLPPLHPGPARRRAGPRRARAGRGHVGSSADARPVVSALDRPLREQAKAVASDDADPAELLEEALARIEERNPRVNAIVATFPEESRRMLAEAPRGPLYGVPVAVKDEWPLPWRAERLGAAAHVGRAPAPGESGPYRALRDAGAVIVGVANMHEYGAGSTGHISAYGPARNPWDTERCPGGSSSGPGAAVAARLVSGAVGADGVGSIRYPSAYCGLTGLKPTFGRSTMQGHHVAQTTTIVSGPVCRDAGDCRLLGGVLFGEVLDGGDRSGLRIGVVPGELWDDCDPEVTEACRAAVESLREAASGTIEEVDFDEREHVLMASILVGQTEELADMTPARVAALG